MARHRVAETLLVVLVVFAFKYVFYSQFYILIDSLQSIALYSFSGKETVSKYKQPLKVGLPHQFSSTSSTYAVCNFEVEEINCSVVV